jgi:hypothetical protein
LLQVGETSERNNSAKENKHGSVMLRAEAFLAATGGMKWRAQAAATLHDLRGTQFIMN